MSSKTQKIFGLGHVGERVISHLKSNGSEVADRLRRVSDGALQMPEALEDAERQHVREIFGKVADIGPEKFLRHLATHLVAEDVVIPHWEEAVQKHPRSFGAIADRIPKKISDDDNDPFSELRGADKRDISRFVVLLVSYILYEDFHDPQPEKAVYNIAEDLFEKLKWVYRYWFNQLEHAQRGSDLEEHFASQNLHFPESGSVSKKRVSVTCAGDLLAVDVLVPENTGALFEGIADFYSTADIVSANLESTVDKGNPVGRTQAPGEAARMNTSEAMFQKFRNEGGINFFSTATNHSLDWGEQGVLATLDVLRGAGVDFAGTADSEEARDEVVVVDRNGINVALLSFTFDLNGHRLPSDKPYLVNEVRFNDADPQPDFSLVQRHIDKARDKGADYIIAYCHWGWEFEMYPHPNVVSAAQTIIDLGVDTILGNHPHVSQPMQRVERDGRPDGLIVYAFGDFVSYHPESRNSKLAYSTRFDIVQEETADGTQTYLANLEMLPLYILNSDRGDGGFDSRILKFENVYNSPDSFGLTSRERDELEHLRDNVLYGILVPRDGRSIVAVNE